MKKYYLRHKYLSVLDDVNYNYLNLDTEYGVLYLDASERTPDYETEFTDEDIEKLVNEFGLNLSEFDKVEVED